MSKSKTIRVILSLATNLDWPLHQLDVKNAFLNRDLEEEVFISIPPGFETDATKNKVCRLRKSLYGLKQSLRAWFEWFTKVLKNHNYLQGQADHTLFIKHSTNEKPSTHCLCWWYCINRKWHWRDGSTKGIIIQGIWDQRPWSTQILLRHGNSSIKEGHLSLIKEVHPRSPKRNWYDWL